MKNNLKTASIAAFAAAIPALIITDWYYKGCGILLLFLFVTVGLVFDQLLRLRFPAHAVSPVANYRKNKMLNIFALVLFVQSPVALIFGNRFSPRLGFWVMAGMLCLGVTISQLAKSKYPYITEA